MAQVPTGLLLGDEKKICFVSNEGLGGSSVLDGHPLQEGGARRSPQIFFPTKGSSWRILDEFESVLAEQPMTIGIKLELRMKTFGFLHTVSNQNFIAVSTIATALASGLQGTNIVINWFGLSGATYQTFYSINLIDWFPYGAAFPGTNGPMQLLLPMDTDPAKFFRLRANN